MPGIIDRLAYLIEYKTDKGSEKTAIRRAKNLGLAIAAAYAAAAAAAGATFGFVKLYANEAEQIDLVASKLGLTVEKLQELQFAGEQTGIDTRSFNTSLQRLVRRLGEAAKGTGEAKVVLEQYGLSADKLSKLTADEQILAMADAFQASAKEGQELSDVIKLFEIEGSGFVNFFNLGRQGIEDLMQTRRNLGGIISKEDTARAKLFNNAIHQILTVFRGLHASIASELLPGMLRVMRTFTKWFILNRDIIKQNLTGFLKGMITVIKALWIALKALLDTISWVIEGFGGLKEALKFFTGFVILRGVMAIVTGFLQLTGAALASSIAIGGINFALKGVIALITTLKAITGIVILEDLYRWFKGESNVLGEAIENTPNLFSKIMGKIGANIILGERSISGVLGMTPTADKNLSGKEKLETLKSEFIINQTNNINANDTNSIANEVLRKTIQELEPATR